MVWINNNTIAPCRALYFVPMLHLDSQCLCITHVWLELFLLFFGYLHLLACVDAACACHDSPLCGYPDIHLQHANECDVWGDDGNRHHWPTQNESWRYLGIGRWWTYGTSRYFWNWWLLDLVFAILRSCFWGFWSCTGVQQPTTVIERKSLKVLREIPTIHLLG